jgi:hypothetical protein
VVRLVLKLGEAVRLRERARSAIKPLAFASARVTLGLPIGGWGRFLRHHLPSYRLPNDRLVLGADSSGQAEHSTFRTVTMSPAKGRRVCRWREKIFKPLAIARMTSDRTGLARAAPSFYRSIRCPLDIDDRMVFSYHPCAFGYLFR